MAGASLGRGGAGFLTGIKWDFLAKAPGPEKYLVCNADEGDPGAYMNRNEIESDPHALLEGMTIAGYVTGAAKGIIYVRAEYPLAVERLATAIRKAKGSVEAKALEPGKYTVVLEPAAVAVAAAAVATAPASCQTVAA